MIDAIKAAREAGTPGPDTFWMWSAAATRGYAGYWTSKAPAAYEGKGPLPTA